MPAPVPFVIPEPSSALLNWGQLAIIIIAAAAVLIAVGKLVNKVDNLATNHESLRVKFDAHVDNDKVHIDSEDIKKRVHDLEQSRWWGRPQTRQ